MAIRDAEQMLREDPIALRLVGDDWSLITATLQAVSQVGIGKHQDRLLELIHEMDLQVHSEILRLTGEEHARGDR